MKRVRKVLLNLSLVCGSVLFVLLLGELLVFRFILLPSDVPRNAYIDGLIRYAPNQTGIYRVQDEIAARFSINEQGYTLSSSGRKSGSSNRREKSRLSFSGLDP